MEDTVIADQSDAKKAKLKALTSLKATTNEKSKTILAKQNNEMARNLEQLSEAGASSWLGALPLKDQGFNLNKSEFRDALILRYDRPLKN